MTRACYISIALALLQTLLGCAPEKPNLYSLPLAHWTKIVPAAECKSIEGKYHDKGMRLFGSFMDMSDILQDSWRTITVKNRSVAPLTPEQLKEMNAVSDKEIFIAQEKHKKEQQDYFSDTAITEIAKTPIGWEIFSLGNDGTLYRKITIADADKNGYVVGCDAEGRLVSRDARTKWEVIFYKGADGALVMQSFDRCNYSGMRNFGSLADFKKSQEKKISFPPVQ